LAQGITARLISAGTSQQRERRGTTWYPARGHDQLLDMSLTASATGWSRPAGPTSVGRGDAETGPRPCPLDPGRGSGDETHKGQHAHQEQQQPVSQSVAPEGFGFGMAWVHENVPLKQVECRDSVRCQSLASSEREASGSRHAWLAFLKGWESRRACAFAPG